MNSTMKKVPKAVEGKVEIVDGALEDVVSVLNAKGFKKLYIDGGKLIQGFLAKDMIDELILTTVPVLLGGGVSLFGDLPEHQEFDHVGTTVMLKALVQSHYKRKR